MITINGRSLPIPTTFPDNTTQIWQLPEGVIHPFENEVVWWFEQEIELYYLQQLKLLIDFEVSRLDGLRINNHLHIPFLPAARQDKPVSNDSTFALLAMAQVINSQNWDRVTSFDTHNPKVASWYIRRFENIQPKLDICIYYDKIIFPDVGAYERYFHILKRGYPKLLDRVVVCRKVRDQSSGKILSFEKDCGPNLEPSDEVIVIDDLCDGGATFIILADTLLGDSVKNSTLYTSHGLYSKGVKTLLSKYDKLITSDTLFAKMNSRQIWQTAAAQSPRWRAMWDAKTYGKLIIFEHERPFG